MVKMGDCQSQSTLHFLNGKPSTAVDGDCCLMDDSQRTYVVDEAVHNSRRTANFSDVARLIGMLTEAFQQDPNHDIHRLIDMAFEMRRKYPNGG